MLTFPLPPLPKVMVETAPSAFVSLVHVPTIELHLTEVLESSSSSLQETKDMLSMTTNMARATNLKFLSCFIFV